VSSPPTKKRQFCDAVAKRLFNLIGEMKQEIAAGGSRVTGIGEAHAPPHRPTFSDAATPVMRPFA